MEYKSAHGVELEIDSTRRAEVKKRFADSPVKLLGLATDERLDWIDPEKLKQAIEKGKRYVQLSHDVGAHGIRVFPIDFHKEVSQEQTIAQIARSLNELGKFAAEYGQLIRIENHGTAGRLTTFLRLPCHARAAG
jgi:sugar phosphate isomerase/epimerase